MTASIIKVEFADILNEPSAVVSFSNGAQICARVVENDSAGVLILHAGKLVRIFEDKSCKVLLTGVTVR